PQGGEFRVNTTTNQEQRNAAVAMSPGGSFVVVWSSDNQDGNNLGVFGQRFDAAGSPQGSEFRVNSFTAGAQQNPAVAMGPGGSFVVVWASNNQDGSSWGVYGQRFNASGVPQGAEFQVNTTTANAQEGPAVAVGAGGSFAVTWSSLG